MNEKLQYCSNTVICVTHFHRKNLVERIMEKKDHLVDNGAQPNHQGTIRVLVEVKQALYSWSKVVAQEEMK